MAKSKNRSKNTARTAERAAAREHAPHEMAAAHRGPADEFGGSVRLAFSDHKWPASRKVLLEHARQHGNFNKSELARLERIPDRKYKSVVDLVNATREVPAGKAARPEAGPVATMEGNRQAAGNVRAEAMDEYRGAMR
jgi:hypothetical protein